MPTEPPFEIKAVTKSGKRRVRLKSDDGDTVFLEPSSALRLAALIYSAAKQADPDASFTGPGGPPV